MTFEERVHALQPMGLPPRQTAFLVTVALHGGYCLQRQYDAFTGRAHGQIGCDFFTRLVTRGLVTRIQVQPNRGYVYHLHAKAIYRALEQTDNRNRREVSPPHIARKLMVLDYVLSASGRDWLTTESDKIAYFTTGFGLALLDLPQRRYASPARSDESAHRYFVHKLPIAAAIDEGPVEFVYLVLDQSGAGFESFLRDRLVKARRSAPPPLRGAYGLDEGPSGQPGPSHTRWPGALLMDRRHNAWKSRRG